MPVYTIFKYQSGKKTIDLSADTLKVALFTSSYTPNQDTDATYSSLTGEVATGGGYTAGGATLFSVTWAQDNTNHRGKLTATNPSWPPSGGGITFRYAILYDSSNATNNLIWYYDFGSDQTVTSGTLTLQFDGTNGALDLT